MSSKLSIILGLLISTISLYSQDNVRDKEIVDSTGTNNNEVVKTEIVQAAFPGGQDSLYSYLARKVHFSSSICPTDYDRNRPEYNGGYYSSVRGYVIARITISDKGEIEDVSIEKSLCTEYDEQAMQIVKDMPQWLPRTENGIAIPTEYLLPIRFKYDSNGFYRYKARLETPDSYTFRYDDDSPDVPHPIGNTIGRHIAYNLEYPMDDMIEGTEGRVVIRIYVTKTGRTDRIEVVKSLSPSCDKAAINAIKKIRKWIPAIINGEYSDTTLSLPIDFRMS